MKVLLPLMGWLIALSSLGQGELEGQVVTHHEDEPVRFAHVYNRSLKIGKVSDLNGQFSVLADVGDSIRISSVGYQDFILVVAQIHLTNYVRITLPRDTVLLPSITIYSDKYYKVPVKYQPAPMEIPGVAKPGDRPPLEPGDSYWGHAIPETSAGLTYGINGPFSYFTKEENEKRKYKNTVKSTQQTIVYQQYILSDTLRADLCSRFDMDSTEYELMLLHINQRYPDVQRMDTRDEIYGWLEAFFTWVQGQR